MKDLRRLIEKNREMIDKALNSNIPIDLLYYIVRKASSDNEKLIAQLKEPSNKQ